MSNYFKHKMRGKNPATIAGMIVFGIIAITGLAILFGFVIMWLWNALMPELFGLTPLTYWQAVGLFILAKIFVGGCGGRGSSRHKGGKHSKSCGKGKDKDKKHDFSKWEHYDKFWQEKGNQAYEDYVEEIENPKSNEEDSSKEISEDRSQDSTEENPEV